MTDYVAPLHIAVLCDSNLVGNRDVAFAVEACRLQLIDAAKAWGLEPPGMALYDRNGYVPKGEGTAIIHLVNSDGNPNSLGLHDDIGGIPVGVVDIAQSGVDWPSVLSHEDLEILGNAQINRWVQGPDGLSYAVELCDPVEAQWYEQDATVMDETRKVPVSNFINPRWLDLPNPTGVHGCDKLQRIADAFIIAPGGYAIAVDDRGDVRYLAPRRGSRFPARKLLPTSRTARIISKGRR